MLKKTAIFTTPITVNSPYVIEITNYSANNVSFVCNDYNATDGGGEWLSSIDLFGTYQRSYNINVGGVLFDADFIIEPHITYDFTAGYDNPIALSCYNSTSNIMFSEKHPLMMNRMYSLAARYGQSELYYGWDFGDGSPSVSMDTAYHTYSAPGNYTVLHTDTLFGYTTTCIDTTTFVIIVDSVEAIMSWIPNGLDVEFYDSSTTNSPGGITGWLWDFGDGNTSTAQFPTHTYIISGTYTVCLIAFNNCAADTICANLTVNCNAPVAGFLDSASNLTVFFTNLSTSDDVFPNYLWDFGDGNTSTQINPVHTFNSPGIYTVCLTISDSCGTDSLCSNLTITCPAPNAAFNSSINFLSATFTDISTQSPISWLWDFGDGNTSTQQNPTNTYDIGGTYTVCLLVSNDCEVDSVCNSITVSPCTLPVAAFVDSSFTLTTYFTNTSTTSYGNPSYFWDFGDGNTSTQTDPVHTYAADGTYTVCLIITDSCGSDSSCISVTVPQGLGMPDYENSIEIYPNPVNDVLNIELKTDAKGFIYAADGRPIRQLILISGHNTVSLDEFQSGIYVLSIETDTAIKSYQIVIK